jgi:hypothetical protein
MGCGFDKGLIAAHYDGETTPSERAEVERHLATCPECARDLASMKDLSASLKPLARASAPISIAEGVIREIGPKPASRRLWIQWGISAAAAVLLAVGTVYLLDRRASPAMFKETATAKSQAPRHKQLGRAEERKEVFAKAAPAESPAKPAAAPPPAPPPAAPLAEPQADAGALKKDENSRMHLDKSKKPAVPVVKVTAADPALIRAEVNAFLKERELKAPTAPPLLGRTAFARDRYVELDLTEEESEALEKRLAALKGIEVTAGSFEVEKKRVAEEAAKSKAGMEIPAEDDRKDGEKAQTEQLGPESKDRSRGFSVERAAERKKFILVLETPPAKK